MVPELLPAISSLLGPVPGPEGAARGQFRPKLTVRAAALGFDSSLVAWRTRRNACANTTLNETKQCGQKAVEVVTPHV